LDAEAELRNNGNCSNGIDFAFWFGIDSSFQWDLSSDTKIGKFLNVKELEKPFELFKYSWLIDEWNYGGNCNDVLHPPFLKVDGWAVNDTVTVQSGEVVSQTYVITNKGDSNLEWEIQYKNDGIISVSKTKGTLGKNEPQTVEVSVNTYALNVGEYSNTIKFLNTNSNLSDQETGTTSRAINIQIVPSSLPSPVLDEPTLFAPTIARLTWNIPDTPNYKYVKGLQIYRTTNPSKPDSWERMYVITDLNQDTHLDSNLLTGTTYYYRMDTYGNHVRSDTSDEVSIEIPRIQPTGDCQAHFSGLLMADHTVSSWFSEVYIVDRYSEYVGAGLYPSNNAAFPKAVASTFDSIAIDTGTKVTLYSKANFQGEILYEQVGPSLINNGIWKDYSQAALAMQNWKEPLQSNYPQSVRKWSSTNMHDWSYGSIIVECGY